MSPRREPRPSDRTLSALVLLAAAAAASPACAQTKVLPAELQIQLAVQAAPEALRDGALVQGYNAKGQLVTLREGTNGLICMAPDPQAEEFEVSCHSAGLEPFFARGRELRAQGITGEDRTKARWDEITAGTLPLPAGTTNHILTGTGFDTATAEIHGPYLRWVIYMPGATTETTGLPTRPAGPGAPWLMFPGTPGAHVMIVPPQSQ